MVYKRTGVTLMDQLNNVNMSRSIASFAIVVLFQAAFAIDVFKPENLPPNLQLNYINRDAVPITALVSQNQIFCDIIKNLEILKFYKKMIKI